MMSRQHWGSFMPCSRSTRANELERGQRSKVSRGNYQDSILQLDHWLFSRAKSKQHYQTCVGDLLGLCASFSLALCFLTPIWHTNLSSYHHYRQSHTSTSVAWCNQYDSIIITSLSSVHNIYSARGGKSEGELGGLFRGGSVTHSDINKTAGGLSLNHTFLDNSITVLVVTHLDHPSSFSYLLPLNHCECLWQLAVRCVPHNMFSLCPSMCPYRGWSTVVTAFDGFEKPRALLSGTDKWKGHDEINVLDLLWFLHLYHNHLFFSEWNSLSTVLKAVGCLRILVSPFENVYSHLSYL